MSQHNDFPTVEELSNGFSEFKLETATEMMGRTIELFDENNEQHTYVFRSEEGLEIKTGDHLNTVEYSVVSPRKNIYMLEIMTA